MSSVLLEVRDLGIKFGGVVAASGINLDVSNGESLAIIGPNGAGKTTFLNICTGWLKPANGTVRFEGRDITAHPPREIARLGISRAFQIPQLFTGHTVIENMLIAASAHADRRNPLQRLDRIPERQNQKWLRPRRHKRRNKKPNNQEAGEDAAICHQILRASGRANSPCGRISKTITIMR